MEAVGYAGGYTPNANHESAVAHRLLAVYDLDVIAFAY